MGIQSKKMSSPLLGYLDSEENFQPGIIISLLNTEDCPATNQSCLILLRVWGEKNQ